MSSSQPPPLSPQESFISMRELDPSPVDDSPVEISRSEYFSGSNSSSQKPTNIATPPSSLPHSSTASTLGLRSHSPIWWLTRLQRYSSYALTPFLAAHLTNTSLIPLLTRSLPQSEKYLLLTRPYYQSPLFEPLVIFLPISLHIASGIALRLYRRHQAVTWYGAENKDERRSLAWPKISGTSVLGYALVPAVAAHVFVNRVMPLRVEGGSSGVGLGYVAHGFARHPSLAYAAYVTLLGVGVAHGVWGWARWLGWSPEGVKGVSAGERQTKRKRRWWMINGVTVATFLLWAAGGLGVVARGGAALGWKGKNYDRLFHEIPLIGKWLAP